MAGPEEPVGSDGGDSEAQRTKPCGRVVNANGHGAKSRGAESIGQRDAGPFASRAVSDLVGQLTIGIRPGLSFQVREHPVPSLAAAIDVPSIPVRPGCIPVVRHEYSPVGSKGRSPDPALTTPLDIGVRDGIQRVTEANIGKQRYMTPVRGELMWVEFVIDAGPLSRGGLVAADQVVVQVGLWTAGGLAGLYAVRIALAWSLMALVREGPCRPPLRVPSTWRRHLVRTALRLAPRHARGRLLSWSGIAVTASVMFATAVPVANAVLIEPTPSASSTVNSSSVNGGPLPVLDRGWVQPTEVRHSGMSARRAASAVLVRRGDTLWGIAARHLPGQVSNARIAAAWPPWYRLNRRVIGSDPNLIRPGMRLRVPGADGEVAQ